MKIVSSNEKTIGEISVSTAHFEKAELSPALSLWLVYDDENGIVFRRDDALALRDYIDQHFGRSDK